LLHTTLCQRWKYPCTDTGIMRPAADIPGSGAPAGTGGRGKGRAMPHNHLTRKARPDGDGPGRLGKPGAPAEGPACYRLPAWRHADEVVAFMAGISTTILLGLSALRDLFCISPFASGSPHVPGLESAILVLAASYLWLAAGPTGEPAGAMKQNGSPIFCTLRESLPLSGRAHARAPSLHFRTE
jgi:hypothetical protein